jgi:hypothetical protein
MYGRKMNKLGAKVLETCILAELDLYGYHPGIIYVKDENFNFLVNSHNTSDVWKTYLSANERT